MTSRAPLATISNRPVFTPRPTRTAEDVIVAVVHQLSLIHI